MITTINEFDFEKLKLLNQSRERIVKGNKMCKLIKKHLNLEIELS